MLAVDRVGSGPPLLLLQGTTSSRRIWRPLLPELAKRATVLAVDLPGHGDSPASSFTPPQWAWEVAARVSARPRQIPADVAVENARAAIGTDSFPRHFAETRRLRFEDGAGIDVPVRIIWGGRDRIALPRKSRNVDRLPPQVSVETWADCGHMLMWDAPERLLETIQSMTGS